MKDRGRSWKIMKGDCETHAALFATHQLRLKVNQETVRKDFHWDAQCKIDKFQKRALAMPTYCSSVAIHSPSQKTSFVGQDIKEW